jgi:D-alanyl-D-alanine carboxypeptidase
MTANGRLLTSHMHRETLQVTRTIFVLLLILGQIPLAAAPRRRAVQPPSSPAVPAALVAAARQAAEASIAAGVPAVQIAVSRGGQVIYSEAFGVTNTEYGTAATSRSVMQIGSLTKQFTAAAILRLAERGALSLDDRIDKYVPEFDPRGRTITLRHLLSHRSGVPRDWTTAPGISPAVLLTAVTRQQVIAGINAQPFEFTPGSKYSYSNAGYMLAGYAVESITGRSFADFVHSELALPLGLLDTGVCGTSNLPRPAGYAVLPVPPGAAPDVRWTDPVHPSGLNSSGSLCSTAYDLARWAHLLANGRVMLPASYATMTTRPPAPLVPYGLGVVVDAVHGHPAVFHDGAIYGYQSFLVYFPQRDIAVAVLLNAWPTPIAYRETIGLAVAKAALDTL